MAANRRRRNGNGVDDIAEAIHRMVNAMQPPVAAQPRTAIAPVKVPTVEDFFVTSQLSSLAKPLLMKWMHGSANVKRFSR